MALRRTIGMGSLALRSAACLRRRPQPELSPCRPFAAPPTQVKRASKDEDDAAGPRINNDITAPFLRLVTDQGHSVVPRHEALQLAARMDMDLVEVHRKSNPPVCKIMDFHKEMYKKDVKEKERLKTKSAIVLRGGENKEVRFKGKTELKDLQVKADAITRLMDRGYRVKCMAMPSGNEEEDLGQPLSRLLGLIKDICIVESGPHLDSKHAYVIVRHVKFATKKAGKKASRAMEDAGKGTRNTSSESPVTVTDSGDDTAECGFDIEDKAISDRFDKMPTYPSSESCARKEGGKINPGQWGPQTSERGFGSKDARSDMEKREKTNQGMAPGETNRYAARKEQIGGDSQGRSPQGPARNEYGGGRHPANDNQRSPQQHSRPLPRFSQGGSPQDPARNENGGGRHPANDNQRFPQQHNRPLPRFSQGGSPQDPARNENGGGRHLANDNQQSPQQHNRPLPRFSQGGIPQDPRRNEIPLNSNQRQFQPLRKPGEAASGTAKSFGIFSAPKPATSELGKADNARSSNPDSPKSYGIFSSPRRESGNKSS